ncbi:DUF255 domain-containing protein [Chitinophaga silvatica]|uniref:DUF255 domain-containing protein n=1 Tax=Chitinophaga silvatica TaxID=2282649 RepID=A0A3E1Y1Z6_9BACT|nr:thioredoxin family protein [Chitinophaga silvatica]RFS18709.1 DUF255 domain-containing protein [Chitinophaga silvatica]
MIKKTIQFLLLAGLLPCAAYSQDSTQFIKASWKELLAKAQKEHKPIFVDTYFEGCIACKEMDVKVFPSKEVKEYMKQNFINTGFDVFKEEFGFDICSRYMLHGFPTFLVISPEGKLVDIDLGYNDADYFLEFLKKANSRYQKSEFHNGFATKIVKEGPDWYQNLYTKKRVLPSDSVVLAFMQQQKDKMSEMSAKAMSICRKMPVEWRNYYLQNRNEYNKRFGKDLNAGILDKLMSADLKALPATYDATAFEAFIAQKSKEYTGDDWNKIKMDFAFSYFVRTHKQTKPFIEFAIANKDRSSNNIRMIAMYGREELNNPDVKALLLNWADETLNEHSSLEVLSSVGDMAMNSNKDQAKKYFTWAALKAGVMGLTGQEQDLKKRIASL